MPSVTALDVPEEVLSCFWDLAAIESDKRADAAAKLLTHLQGAQKAGGAASAAPDASAATAELDAALGRCAPLVAYSMRRLVKGLTSGRKGARQGFALALTAALAQLPCFGGAETLALVNSLPELASGGGRDEYFGQLFGLGAIVRAKKLEPAAAVAVAEQAVGLALKKSFLREAAATVIRELAEKNPDCMGKVLADAGELRAWLSAPADAACPEALELALRLWRHMPQDLAKACQLLPACSEVPSAGVFSQQGRKGKDKGDRAVAEATFAEAHLRRLLPVLRVTTAGHPRMHIVWPTLLSLLLPGYTGEGTGAQTAIAGPELEAFWAVLVETDIFESPSHDRKYLGFALFGQMAAALKPDAVPALLTPNFVHALGTHVSKKDSALRPVAQQCMEQLAAAVAACGAAARAQALLAVERNGNGFLVKQLTAKRVADNASDADIASRATQLMAEYDALVGGGDADAEGGGLGRQKSVLSQLAGIAKRQQGGPAVAADVFKFLVDRGVLANGGDGPAAFELASQCASLLVTTVDAASRAQAVVAQQRRKDDKAAVATDPLETVAAYVAERLADGAEPAQEATEEAAQARATLGALRLALEKVLGGAGLTPEQHKQAEALKHLVILLELHAVAHPATADPELAVDLQRVADAVFPAPAAAAKVKKAAKKAEEEDAPAWEDALVDIVLAILSRNEAPLPSAPLRDAAERLFKAYAAHVTATGVQDLLEVVARPLDDNEDEDEEGMSDEEMEDAEEEGGSGSESGSESDSESGSEEEEEEEGEESGDEEEGEGGSGSDAEEVPDMTDEQMFRMDSQLGAYFASMHKGRDARKLRQEAVSFKLRALACLEMVMKKAPESGLVVGMASPLLAALVAARKPSGDVALAERLGGVLRNQLARCKPEGAEVEVDEEELRAQLRRALYFASRHEDRAVQEAAAAVFVFLERAAFAGAEGVATEFVAAALDDFFGKKKTRLGRPFFQGLLRRLPEAAAAALPTVLQTCGAARNEFMRQEAFGMLELAVKSAGDGAAEALRRDPALLAGALLAAVKEPFSKKQRRMEALKAVTAVAQTLEAKGAGLAGVLGAKRAGEVGAALAAALEANPKDVHLQRLADLVDAEAAAAEEQPKAKKKAGAAAAAAKPAGKKRAAGAATAVRPAKRK